jgi:hypothetical protein
MCNGHSSAQTLRISDAFSRVVCNDLMLDSFALNKATVSTLPELFLNIYAQVQVCSSSLRSYSRFPLPSPIVMCLAIGVGIHGPGSVVQFSCILSSYDKLRLKPYWHEAPTATVAYRLASTQCRASGAALVLLPRKPFKFRVPIPLVHNPRRAVSPRKRLK